jgi:hypothetical protein
MRLSFLPLVLPFFAATSLAEPVASAPAHPPKPPGLEYLYTCLVECHNGLYTTQGPRGLRTAIPIIGGNVTGPRINGRIRNLGADWGLTDPQTGVPTIHQHRVEAFTDPS